MIPHCPCCGDDVSEPYDCDIPGSYRCLACGAVHGNEPDDGVFWPEDDHEGEDESSVGPDSQKR